MENTIDIDLQIESINSARKELKKHFGEQYELGALVHTIPLLEELKQLRNGRKAIPIATIKFSKEDMQKMVDEKVKEIELDIQSIYNKAIDEFAEAIMVKATELSEKVVFDGRLVGDALSLDCVSDMVLEIALDMKGEKE